MFNDIQFFTRTKKILKLLILFLLGFNFITSNAQQIDFDAVYGNSGDIREKIQEAIDKADDNDIILFKSQYYNLGGFKAILINKPLTIEGATPDNGTFFKSAIGASGIKTTLGNTADIQIRSNDVNFKNISLVRKDQTDGPNKFDILIDARHNDYFGDSPFGRYKGLKFNNVVLAQAAYSFHAGNGVEVEMNNVTFIDFRRIGYWIDREGRVNNTGKAVFNNCLFKLREESDTFKHQFDFRAISFDAGNTEYPVILDLDDSVVNKCRFEHTGVAVSRCHSLTVEDSEFYDREGLVDQLHFEEFSYNMNVFDNTFDCGGPNPNLRTKIIVIDRELQLCRDITIDGNTIKNDYNFFISSYSVENIRITNNDFTEANAVNDNSINFSFYEAADSEPIPLSSRFPSKNVTIKNNEGLGTASNKGLQLLYLNDASKDNFDITDYQGRRTFIQINEPTPIIEEGAYEIINKETGAKLTASGNSVTMSMSSDDTTKWNVIWNSPYTFFIENKATGNFLETDSGYTENDLFKKGTDGTKANGSIIPYASNSYSGTSVKPFWAFVPVGSEYEIFAGGNEKQSALAVSNSNVNLLYGKFFNKNNIREPVILKDDAKWSFIRTTGQGNTSSPTGNNLIIEAESFNETGGTFDDSFANGPGSGVNIQGGIINYVNRGDWVEYLVNIPEAGVYEIEYVVATPQIGATIDFSVSGTFFNTTEIPNTGSYASYENVKASKTANFTAGTHILRLTAGGHNWAWNLDKFSLKRIGSFLSRSIHQKVDVKNDGEVGVYPNPVDDYLQVRNIGGYHTVNVFTITGRKLKTKKLNQNQNSIDMANLSEGVYLIELVSNRGRSIKKVLVKHH